ncbi:cytochrome P450 oxidoreductase OrdA-like protein [Punctularia strigosozonata HHB-11173 SS5]|uniref:cytochrome P450 oxidoreductase OrdA-like protein n=1 Tax=Punctularia strigosozonata (strain HHB-11173) TaxID=741275 RepID=UPI0004418009|nr:cytochrome P450 oxidoreductase OrdA-like protein [Punctularia strigosozonata HHB-11173 SS5]EIN10223.1 cytochrome P450 oxidoreductase OrdA-like protein [Punctularia strigosozonata HHB-11173 SS5]
MTTPIPQPPAIPFLGNIRDIDQVVPARSFSLLAKQYGGIFKLAFAGDEVIFISSYELQNELSDEKRFEKAVRGPLEEIRAGAGDGLFTAYLTEPNWGKAHRLLMPAFGTVALRGMFDDMMDVCSQLLLKWERFGPTHVIDPIEDYTRLTLDTISLCAMSYRLNSFYMENQLPFVKAMSDFLGEAALRSRRPGIVQAFMKGSQAKWEQDIKAMTELADRIIADRKANPFDSKDVLNTMLNGRDPKTGEGLSDENIRYNVITFLIAGHETTSGMLGFTTYYLLKNPHALEKLREEIDSLLGDQPIQYSDISKMPYLVACMRESLRLAPTAFARTVLPKEDTTLCNGKYAVAAGQRIVMLAAFAHLDPTVWGEDAEEFRPERMLDGKFEALPPNAWQPFGYGMRGCIGRAFALQEAHLVLASIFQKFDLTMEDPSYSLQIKQTLTIKPDRFYVRVSPRKGRRHLVAAPSSTLFKTLSNDGKESESSVPAPAPVDPSRPPVYVLYGSNGGSSEAFAQRLATDAASHGFRATLGTLDSATGHVPTDGPVVVITASYEGEPPDNAAQFVSWLSALKGTELEDVNYAVFGCGNRDWVQTYQRIPKLCDSLFEQRGAKPIIPRGEGDASDAMFFQAFDNFGASLWETLKKTFATTDTAPGENLSIKVIDPGTSRPVALRQTDAALGTVHSNKLLTAPGAAEKRHIEIQLPEGMSYQAGDYLAILPRNPDRDVRRALARFGIPDEQEINITAVGPTSLPVGKDIAVNTLLSGYVELSQPATTRDLHTLISHATASSEASVPVLQTLLNAHRTEVVEKRLSVLDILEAHPSIKVEFTTFLNMLPAMRIRQYSISSSSLLDPQRATLTVSVLDAPALSGREDRFLGVASTFLASLRKGDKVHVSVRASSTAFHLPADPEVPVVMFCAGSGLAPFRGFIQERAVQKRAGRKTGEMLLFFGCRAPEQDFLYFKDSGDEAKAWVDDGVVDVRPAFSRKSEDSAGCKYVQDRIWHDKEDIHRLFNAQARFYSCGSRKMATGVKEKLVALIKESGDIDDAEADAAFERVRGRYATDIFD